SSPASNLLAARPLSRGAAVLTVRAAERGAAGRVVSEALPAGSLVADGGRSALVQETATDAKVTLRDGEGHTPVPVATFPATRFPSFPVHGDTATTYNADGRIVAIDLRTREVPVNLSMRDKSLGS